MRETLCANRSFFCKVDLGWSPRSAHCLTGSWSLSAPLLQGMETWEYAPMPEYARMGTCHAGIPGMRS